MRPSELIPMDSYTWKLKVYLRKYRKTFQFESSLSNLNSVGRDEHVTVPRRLPSYSGTTHHQAPFRGINRRAEALCPSHFKVSGIFISSPSFQFRNTKGMPFAMISYALNPSKRAGSQNPRVFGHHLSSFAQYYRLRSTIRHIITDWVSGRPFTAHASSCVKCPPNQNQSTI